ncbi:hypothetical protein B0H17DRAFT_1217592 [Mycena rosella]|uniref:Uncharacterized protein n=1 Tax=Mycena rosella TaxID=1033263 RepID=A0AAD7BVF1_MYCRO|nr:hypothetical protein B0H17DRAFT_1217592 [Mycena rosella]
MSDGDDPDYRALADEDDQLEDNNLDGMLHQLMVQKPHLNKWMVSTPEVEAKKAKARKTKEQRKPKCKAPTADSEDDDVVSKPNKKGKHQEDSDNPRIELTGYIHVMKPTSTVASSSCGRSKPKAESFYIQRGPFQFTSHCNYEAFLSLMAATLPCPDGHIVLDKVEWKPQTPANCSPLPLGGAIGYKVLMNQISKSKDKIVIISMPGPKKPADNAPFWSTTEDDAVPPVAPSGASDRQNNTASSTDNSFDFAELEASSTEGSVGEQKMRFESAVGPKVEALKEHWPLNDSGKWIYTDKVGFQWELTPIRLSVWGAHLACGSATLDEAPLSGQFNISNRIKHTAASTNHVAAPTIIPNAPAPPPASPSNAERLMEMLTMSMLHQNQQQQQSNALVPITNQPLVIPVAAASAPQSPVKPCHCFVPLEEFCSFYGIMPCPERLQKLEYKPGDTGIVKLTHEDWNEFAGFPSLTWQKVLDKHRQFVKDAHGGLWA